MPDTAEKRKPNTKSAPFVYHLALTIGPTRYEIERLAETLVPGARAFRLIKDDGTIYDVAQTTYGPECDCPDYLFRRDGLDPAGCKHIKALVRSGLIDREIGRLQRV